MGLFTYVVGNLRCALCGHQGMASIQTKLFFTDRSNHSHEYAVGDWVVIDGLCDYARLHPWLELLPWLEQRWLDVIMGEWDCSHCLISWQWARVSFRVLGNARQEPIQVRIGSVSTFIPEKPSDFDGVHFVEEWLALLGTSGSPRKELKAFEDMRLPDRIDRMIKEFQAWREDVRSSHGTPE